MEKGAFVKAIKPGESVCGVFVVSAAIRGETQKGDPFWSVTLMDRSGNIEGKIWAPDSKRFDRLEAGSMAAVSGIGDTYHEKLQLKIRKFELLDNDQATAIDLSDFVKTSKADPSVMLARLAAICRQELTHEPLRNLVLSVLDDPEIQEALKIAPAAKFVHQAYAGGLLEHTLNVATLCVAFAHIYQQLDRQILLAGAVLHDIGKIREYAGGIFIDDTHAGRLFGHIYLGLELLAPFLAASSLELPLQEHLKHLIISHHGELEYGSPRLPQTAEAFALHYADNLDAKLALCAAQFEEAGKPPVWSQRVNFLERRLLLPVPTPSTRRETCECGMDDDIPVDYYEEAAWLAAYEEESGVEAFTTGKGRDQGTLW